MYTGHPDLYFQVVKLGVLKSLSGTNAFNADNEMTSYNGSTLGGACPERSRRDADGQLTSDGHDTYTLRQENSQGGLWDVRRHLSAVSGADAASFVGACPERIRRNALGRRAKKTVNGTTTQFLGACPERSRRDGLNPVQELNGSGTAVANLLTGLNVDEYPSASLRAGFVRSDSSGAMSMLSDALGSTVALTNSSVAIGSTYTYQPFGATTASGPANANSYQFTGRENDAFGFAMYFYRARYYSAVYERFVSQDPLGFRAGDADLYGYVNQDPISAIDPLGLSGYFLRFFVGIGAAFTVGTNPDGAWFVTVDFGFGEDFGGGYDPNATSPGYDTNGPSSCSIGTFAQAGVHLGIADFGVGDETGTDFGPNGPVPYSSPPALYASVSGPPSDSFQVGGSAGGRISFGGP